MKNNIYMTGPVPQGKNGLTSRANYSQRKKYDTAFYSVSALYDQENYIDLRNIYNNFCKINVAGDPINISEAFLKNLNDDFYAVNFVVDAFNDLKLLCANNVNIKEEKFKNPKAKRGWVNLHKKYHDHMNFLFKEFMKQINSTYKDKKIDNFEKFVISFVKFLDGVIFKIPFLKSSYTLSKEYPEINTGFIIEIETGDASDDNKKFKDYFTNYEYNQFVKLCNQANFSIDKDCPWRLVYNTFSEKSEEYMKKYNINRNNLIDTYFYNTQEFDLQNLKQYMVILYNTFVQEKPTSQNVQITSYGDKQFLTSKFIDRKQITIEEVNLKYTNNFWFNVYCHIYFVENKLNLTHQQYLTLLKDMDQFYSLNGFKISLQELKKITKNISFTETRGEYNFTILRST